ncbi:hypothetical protein [Motilimonas pumila]|uniref:Uncharacterized protein n=1 Tax=Motilimonas pumila TaxID=2303987 RepID=A0A418Y9A8_9GAMM|nr:hypothetical protein [Motilimonas pumila]RJG36867.1 hypothetical protein D1Z90_20155 [Motilimonas pumila]
MNKPLLKNSMIVSSLLAVFSAGAAAQSVAYDTDGPSRWTSYQNSALKSVVTSSDSALDINFVAHPALPVGEVDCTTSPTLHNSDTGEFITTGSIGYADAKGSVLWGSFESPAEYAHNNKVAKFTCYKSDGSTQVIQHKIPGAPEVNGQMRVKGIGKFSDGRYPQLKISGFVSINNKTNEGRCVITSRNFASSTLFNGQTSKTDFYSDYFSLTEKISSHNGDTLEVGFTCSNSGGSTSFVKRWDISGEEIKPLASAVTSK